MKRSTMATQCKTEPTLSVAQLAATSSTFRATCLLTVMLLLTLGAIPSFANSIPIFGTGVPGINCGNPSLFDPNYHLISAPAGVPLNALTTVPFPGWVPPPAGTCWINPYGDATVNAPTGNYDYQTTFNLSFRVDPKTAILTGQFAADNDACIKLNGSPTLVCTKKVFGFSKLTNFTIGPCPGGPNCGSGGFLSGTNTLDFVVNNDEGGPTGLVVAI